MNIGRNDAFCQGKHRPIAGFRSFLFACAKLKAFSDPDTLNERQAQFSVAAIADALTKSNDGGFGDAGLLGESANGKIDDLFPLLQQPGRKSCRGGIANSRSVKQSLHSIRSSAGVLVGVHN